ncbi:MAG: SpoIIE family protein phosphatase [Treponema sp.]|nr:SpoIIE family protein phosphatase [Treponema sp.]
MINPVFGLAALLILFSVLGTGIAIRRIAGVAAENSAIKKESIAIITGDLMPADMKKKTVKIKLTGRGLRYKLVSFIIILVISVVVMISAPLYLLIMNLQRAVLEQSLQDRCKTLLEGLASSAGVYLPAGNILELGLLPARSETVPDTCYVTITGYVSGSINNEYVLTTNDPDILSKIDTTDFIPGVSKISDRLSPYLDELNLISGEMRSHTEYARENINKKKITNYIFYKPILFRQGTDDKYTRGIVRMEVATDFITGQILHNQILLLKTILVYAAAAIIIGATGAFIFTTLIIKPVRELAGHIEIIRDTEDKVKLSGHKIQIKSKDEIAILGNTINDMTRGLVKAAAAASDLFIGKEIQKKFIPLTVDKYGNKQSSGLKETDTVDFFGYYEGAKGLSGDYFDYKDLDGRYYAIIKCDVAGNGIPAAFIMIQVATMFLNYFKQWKPDAEGMRIEDIVYQINDFIETLAFKGRFAAFTLCLYDSKTGMVRFCNAGDNIIRLYDASEGRMKTLTLPESPAAGVLPNFMIENAGGYKVQTLTIEKGDILLLYTDGIEEAKRKFRNSDFKEIICAEGPVNTPHENHICGQSIEEMGHGRVEAIVNAVMAKETYTLRKYHNPEGGQDLQFDFSGCQGRVEEVIMAMVSAEKMFRCYKNPKNTEKSKVLVDKKIDEFLRDHFLQYGNYCANTREFPENNAYMYYTQISEDEQYDDLTILGIKRKNN